MGLGTAPPPQGWSTAACVPTTSCARAQVGPFSKCIPDFEYIKKRNAEFGGDIITYFYAANPDLSHSLPPDLGSCVLSGLLKMYMQ